MDRLSKIEARWRSYAALIESGRTFDVDVSVQQADRGREDIAWLIQQVRDSRTLLVAVDEVIDGYDDCSGDYDSLACKKSIKEGGCYWPKYCKLRQEARDNGCD